MKSSPFYYVSGSQNRSDRIVCVPRVKIKFKAAPHKGGQAPPL